MKKKQSPRVLGLFFTTPFPPPCLKLFSKHLNWQVLLITCLQLFSTRVLDTHLRGLKAACIGSALSKFRRCWGWSNLVQVQVQAQVQVHVNAKVHVRMQVHPKVEMQVHAKVHAMVQVQVQVPAEYRLRRPSSSRSLGSVASTVCSFPRLGKQSMRAEGVGRRGGGTWVRRKAAHRGCGRRR